MHTWLGPTCYAALTSGTADTRRTAENSVLLDRTKYRRVDMDTGRVYHMADPGALSAPITPLTKEGAPDSEVLARWGGGACVMGCMSEMAHLSPASRPTPLVL